MDEACCRSEKCMKYASGSLSNHKENVKNEINVHFKPKGEIHECRKEPRSFALSLPNALVKACDNTYSRLGNKDPLDRRDLLLKVRDVSHLQRSLSDTAIHTEFAAATSTYHSPPYSNFARYLPCLSTPTDDPTSTNFSSLSVSQSGDTSDSSFRLPISASQLSLPEPPDGGWGWVVVFAAFIVHMVTEGVIVSFGIFIEDLVEEFQESMSATSWVGSFSYGVPALATPISSLILNQYGCRITCILGAFVSALGCLIGCFANSLLTLVFTFGILSGLGTSLSMTAALVIVSMYFDDRRATATGLSIAGTGVGALIFAPAVEALLNVYTWRGTFMLMAGALLNLAVCGALMRPVETRNERRHRQRLAWLEHFAKESGLPHLTKSADYQNTDVLGRIKILRDRLLAPTKAHAHANKIQALQSGNSTISEFKNGFSKSTHCDYNTSQNARSHELSINSNSLAPPISLKQSLLSPKNANHISVLPVIPENPHNITEISCNSQYSALPDGLHEIKLIAPQMELSLINSAGDQSTEQYHTMNLHTPKTFNCSCANRGTTISRSLRDVSMTNCDITITRRSFSLPNLIVFASTYVYQFDHTNHVPVETDAILPSSDHVEQDNIETKPKRRSRRSSLTQNQLPSAQERDCRNWIETATRSRPILENACFKEMNANGDYVSNNIPIVENDVQIDPSSHLDVLYRSSLIKAFGLNRASRCTALSLPDLTRVHRIRRRSSSSSSSSSSYSTCMGWHCCGDLDNGDNKCMRFLSECLTPCNILLPEVDARYLCQRLCDVRLFRRSTFDLFVLSNFLLYFWYNVTYFFMGVHAIELGLSETSAALLFSVLGGANMVGEIVVGLLADREWVDALTLYLFMLIACGFSTTLVPLLKSFVPLSLYSGVYGMGLAANDALCTILLVEFVGLHHLTSALGICFFCQGVANIFGPPLIGYIIDSSGSKNLAFIISGFGMILSGLSVVPIIIQRIRRKRAREVRRKQHQEQQKLADKQITRYDEREHVDGFTAIVC